MPRVSVILPVYNAESYVAMTIQSVLDQTFGDFELIAINDGSTDGSLEVMRKFDDPRLRIVEQDNRGLAATLNRAAAFANGEYLARIDADDLCKLDRFERQVYFLDNHPEVALVSGAVEYIDKVGNVLGRTFPVTAPRKIRKQILAGCDIITHPAVMIRSDVFRMCGGYSEIIGQYFEDVHLWHKLLRRGFGLAMLPQVVISYRLVHGAISNCVFSGRQRELKRLIQSYDEPPAELMEKFLLCFHETKVANISKKGTKKNRIKKTIDCRFSTLLCRCHIPWWLVECWISRLKNVFV